MKNYIIRKKVLDNPQTSELIKKRAQNMLQDNNSN